jgi:hypothetical protein
MIRSQIYTAPFPDINTRWSRGYTDVTESMTTYKIPSMTFLTHEQSIAILRKNLENHHPIRHPEAEKEIRHGWDAGGVITEEVDVFRIPFDDSDDDDAGDDVAMAEHRRAHPGESEDASPMKVGGLLKVVQEQRAKIKLNRWRSFTGYAIGARAVAAGKAADAKAAAGEGEAHTGAGAEGDEETVEEAEEEEEFWEEGEGDRIERVMSKEELEGEQGELFLKAVKRNDLRLAKLVPIPEGKTRRPDSTPEQRRARALEAVRLVRANPQVECAKSRASRKNKGVK